MNFFIYQTYESNLDLRLLKDNLQNLNNKNLSINSNYKNKTLKKGKKVKKKTLRNL